MNQSFKVTGLKCQGCVKIVKESLLSINKITEVDIDLANNQMNVVFDNPITPDLIIETVKKAGFSATIL